ncbi:MAG TPA: carboxypeptidase-like regulatory domain-containing protein, partial [Terriglobia bacterium]|nr:carboxypeptidase-like regulatory domain-containing protein [Terriglobia bacterium]
MKSIRVLFLFASAFALTGAAFATIFGNVRGIVHDPQHRPIRDAGVVLHASGSAWSKSGRTNGNGEFEFSAVPAGAYLLTVTASGF